MTQDAQSAQISYISKMNVIHIYIYFIYFIYIYMYIYVVAERQTIRRWSHGNSCMHLGT